MHIKLKDLLRERAAEFVDNSSPSHMIDLTKTKEEDKLAKGDWDLNLPPSPFHLDEVNKKLNRKDIFKKLKEILDKKLYVRGWKAQYYFGSIYNGEDDFGEFTIKDIIAEYKNGKMIGWSALIESRGWLEGEKPIQEIWTYVSKKHRNRGIARKLIQKIKNDHKLNLSVDFPKKGEAIDVIGESNIISTDDQRQVNKPHTLNSKEVPNVYMTGLYTDPFMSHSGNEFYSILKQQGSGG